MPKNKTDNFLKAIRRYAKQQKSVMKGEVKQLKTERLKEAEEKAKRDSQRLIKDKLQETRTRQTAILAKKTQDGQRKLFIARSAMVEEVFKKAADKLVEYAKSDAYTSKLTDSAKAIADVFDGRDCVLYVNERDLGAAEGIKALPQGVVHRLVGLGQAFVVVTGHGPLPFRGFSPIMGSGEKIVKVQRLMVADNCCYVNPKA